MRTLPVLLFLVTSIIFSQNSDLSPITLDGKPAFLNIKTGEIVHTNAASNSNTQASVTNTTKAIHVVKRGETYYSIARDNNVTVAQLLAFNNLQRGDILSVGQQLKVSASSTLQKPTNLITNTASQFHIVKKGNTLYSLSKQYNTTVNKIKQLNNLSSNVIAIGQKLKMY